MTRSPIWATEVMTGGGPFWDRERIGGLPTAPNYFAIVSRTTQEEAA